MLKKIGISGSFGRGNLGDELFVQTHKRYFGRRAKLFLLTGLPQPYYLRNFSKTLVDEMDAIAIGGGDLICPYREVMDLDFCSPFYLRRPVHMVGIGVQVNKDLELRNTMRRWRTFLRHKNLKSFTARDAFSKAWLEEKMFKGRNVPYHPDIVLSLPMPKVWMKSKPRTVGLVTRSISKTEDLVRVREAAEYLQGQGWNVRHIVFGVGKHGQQEYEKSKHLIIDGKETIYSSNMNTILRAIGKCSLVLSMKLHSSIVASMYDVPVIALSQSLKMKQFMKSIDREDMILPAKSKNLMEILKNGVPPINTDKVKDLREQSTEAMENFVDRVLG